MTQKPKGISPKPWKIIQKDSVHSSDGSCVADCRSSWADNESNVKLIAAAPDLLESLQELLEQHYPTNHPFWETYGKDPNHPAYKARQTIAKAKGVSA